MRSVSRHWQLAYSKLLSLDWRWSTSTPYGATDGRVLLLNQSGIEKLARQPSGTKLIAFLLVHESLHALLGHGWRCAKMRDSKTANIAADYIINAMIAMRNRELGQEAFPLIEGVLFDESISGDKSVEQLYRELLKPEENTPNEDKDADEGESAEEPDSGSSGDDGSSPDSGDDPAADGGPATTDDDLSDFVGTGAPDTMAPLVDPDEAEDDVVQQIESDNERLLLADHIAKNTGTDVGAVGNRIAGQRKIEPEMHWAELIREWVRSRSRNGWGAPFNPAIYGGAGLVSAGRRSRTAGDIVLVIDTSGSVPQRTYDRFLSEAQSVLDEVKPERLHLLSVSHYVCDSKTLESGDRVPDSLKGGGGTLFQPAFDWVEEQQLEVDFMIYLTDGLSSDRPTVQAPDYPVLWASTILQQHDYPFGDVVMVNHQ
jgi:predicted metal-dependent peptidase